jgi:poly(3-hydroxybutyrate) depolymerase
VPGSFPGAGRRVYPGFMQHTGFVAMNPDRHATSHYDYFQNLIKGDDASTEAHRKFYDEYNAVLDMDADYYLETIKTVFQEFKLVNGTWDVMSVDGQLERVKPGDIKTTAVMTVEGELDDISGPGQTRAALDLCSGVPDSQKKHLDAIGAGHYGIFSGRRWRETVYPEVKAFILAQNASLTQAAVPAVAPVLAAPALAAPEVSAKTAAKPAAAAPRTVKKAAKKPAPVAVPKAKPVVQTAPAVKEELPAPATPAAEAKPAAQPEPAPAPAAEIKAQAAATPTVAVATKAEVTEADPAPTTPEKSAA